MPELPNIFTLPTDDAPTASLLVESLPLLVMIRQSLSELQGVCGRETLDRILDLAPLDACVKLADVWSMAALIGVDTVALKRRLDPEDQFVLEFVTTIYAAGRSASADGRTDEALPELVQLVEQSSSVAWELSEAY